MFPKACLLAEFVGTWKRWILDFVDYQPAHQDPVPVRGGSTATRTPNDCFVAGADTLSASRDAAFGTSVQRHVANFAASSILVLHGVVAVLFAVHGASAHRSLVHT